MSVTALLSFAFLFGTLVGSFLNVVIYRLPAGLSIVSPRSRCGSCGTPIAAWNNIPILSWLLLRGRCATCEASISPRYPLVELLTGVLWAAVAARYGLTWAGLVGVVLSSALVAITFIDIDIWEIPDEISLPGIVIGAIVRPLAFGSEWYDGLAGAALGGGVLWSVRAAFMRLRGVEGMGLGDVKLTAMLGAFLGLQSILPVILVASTTGALIGVLILAIRKGPPAAPPAPVSPVADDDDWVPPPNAVPFGPFLALGGLAELLIGPLRQLFLSRL